VGPADAQSVLTTVRREQQRTARQVESLESLVASIVEASELTSTDDEHDSEGATIAYERAQAIALLRQAREDLDALAVTRKQLESTQVVTCSVCGRTIDLERIAALPTTSRCIRCAA
jgi:RNA polymerase-binding transcription factor DksA